MDQLGGEQLGEDNLLPSTDLGDEYELGGVQVAPRGAREREADRNPGDLPSAARSRSRSPVPEEPASVAAKVAGLSDEGVHGEPGAYGGFGGGAPYSQFNDGGFGGGGGEVRPGDWTCPSCQANVFASKIVRRRRPPRAALSAPPARIAHRSRPFPPPPLQACFRCATPKPGITPGSFAAPGGFGGGGSSDVRPGDWTCAVCGANVFASKYNCFRCQAPKPAGAGGGGFGGPRCGSCGMPGGMPGYGAAPPYGGGGMYGGGGGYGMMGGMGMGGGGGGDVRPGDWTCPNCHGNVFASKNACYKCGTLKPDVPSPGFAQAPGAPPPYGGGGGYGGGFGGGGGYGGGGGGNVRPGDWTCPSCGANVFASKTNCFKCNAPKPGGMGGAGY